jgi:lipoprotein-releasing system ATP-binding protein
MSDFFSCEDIHKSFYLGGQELKVLRGVDLSVNPGEILIITGASGTGKTTLLHILGFLDIPTKGRIYLHGKEMEQCSESEKARARNRSFGFVFQAYHLLPELTALENVLLPTMVGMKMKQWRAGRNELEGRARGILAEVGLADREKHKPTQLSGGERQRVAIARSLVNEPEILFCDEPTGNLDPHTGEEVLDLLYKLNNNRNQTLIIVTHEKRVANSGFRTRRLEEGRLV